MRKRLLWLLDVKHLLTEPMDDIKKNSICLIDKKSSGDKDEQYTATSAHCHYDNVPVGPVMVVRQPTESQPALLSTADSGRACNQPRSGPWPSR